MKHKLAVCPKSNFLNHIFLNKLVWTRVDIHRLFHDMFQSKYPHNISLQLTLCGQEKFIEKHLTQKYHFWASVKENRMPWTYLINI